VGKWEFINVPIRFESKDSAGFAQRHRLDSFHVPRLLNFIVAIYLIVIALVGLMSAEHWLRQEDGGTG
jgi:hypothetical protein